MQIMADGGMSKYEVLRSATEAAGECTGKRCGVTKSSQRRSHPRRRPVADLSDLHRSSGVMVLGRWHAAPERQRAIAAIQGTSG